jgi:hypothetical protein
MKARTNLIIRPATEADVPTVFVSIREHGVYEKLTHEVDGDGDGGQSAAKERRWAHRVSTFRSCHVCWVAAKIDFVRANLKPIGAAG